MFEGSFVALITPLTEQGIDEPALKRLVQWHIEQGTQGLVPVGTTGESPTLTEEEHVEVIRIVVEETKGRVPVIAGAGSNNTREALEYNSKVADAGADASLHVTGYYNRPSQEGLYQHFKALNDASKIPIILYNIPPRAIIDIEVDTMARLAELDKIVGVKDATCDLSRPGREQLRIAKPFCYLSGEDATAVAYNAAGGRGCISVTANAAPALCAEMQQACLNGDFIAAMAVQRKLMPLHEVLFQEPSPAGIKYACSLLEFCAESCRLPIVPLSEVTKAQIRKAMVDLNLI